MTVPILFARCEDQEAVRTFLMKHGLRGDLNQT